MIKVTVKGSFDNSKRFFSGTKNLGAKFRKIMDRYGPVCVSALQSATPVDTGKTADSWSYSIENWGIALSNSNTTKSGIPIIALIFYGHGTKGGGYVYGRDFINPTLQPIFDKIVSEIDREVQSL